MAFFNNLERPREFKIETYYYNQNEPDDPKRRIHFRRIRHSKQIPKTNPIRLILSIAILAFVIYILQRQSHNLPNSTQPERIQVEEIIVVD